MLTIIILFIAAYITGSINFSVLLFRIRKKEDPRSKFSGNPGTVNIYRQAGFFWAAVVFLLDFSRAVALSALSLYLLKPEYAPLICLSLILGNRYPCFHNFRGGKGVANYLGFTALINPLLSACAAVVWVVVYKIIRVSFIASICMLLILVFAAIKAANYNICASFISLLTAIFIIYNHRTNMKEFKDKLKTNT
ncbi:MAG: glycerol-3-phosphate acyltransferase [Spirochaetes bacterium]|nr:glycerol-3-phosphate acyltransferase [Spirochaetota bacterium]